MIALDVSVQALIRAAAQAGRKHFTRFAFRVKFPIKCRICIDQICPVNVVVRRVDVANGLFRNADIIPAFVQGACIVDDPAIIKICCTGVFLGHWIHRTQRNLLPEQKIEINLGILLVGKALFRLVDIVLGCDQAQIRMYALQQIFFSQCFHNLVGRRDVVIVNVDAKVNGQNAFGLHQMLHDHVVCPLPVCHRAAGVMDFFRPIHSDLCRPDVVLLELFCYFFGQQIAICNDTGRILHVLFFAESNDSLGQAFDDWHPNKRLPAKPGYRKIFYAAQMLFDELHQMVLR